MKYTVSISWRVWRLIFPISMRNIWLKKEVTPLLCSTSPHPVRSGKFILDSVVSDVKPQMTIYANTNCTKTEIDELYELFDVEDSIYTRSESFSSSHESRKKHTHFVQYICRRCRLGRCSKITNQTDTTFGSPQTHKQNLKNQRSQKQQKTEILLTH